MLTRLAFVPQASRNNGVQALFVYGLGTQVTPKASLQQLKKTRMAVSKSKSIEKIKQWWFAFAHSHLCRHTIHFFQPLPFRFCHALCPQTFWLFFYSLRGYGQTHTNKKFLHGLCPALILCGGKGGRPCLLFVRAFSSTGSPAPPRACAARARYSQWYTM